MATIGWNSGIDGEGSVLLLGVVVDEDSKTVQTFVSLSE